MQMQSRIVPIVVLLLLSMGTSKCDRFAYSGGPGGGAFRSTCISGDFLVGILYKVGRLD